MSDELYAEVVGPILLTKLEREEPVTTATARRRHHLAPLLDVG